MSDLSLTVACVKLCVNGIVNTIVVLCKLDPVILTKRSPFQESVGIPSLISILVRLAKKPERIVPIPLLRFKVKF